MVNKKAFSVASISDKICGSEERHDGECSLLDRGLVGIYDKVGLDQIRNGMKKGSYKAYSKEFLVYEYYPCTSIISNTGMR